jgi:hypothetical protein
MVLLLHLPPFQPNLVRHKRLDPGLPKLSPFAVPPYKHKIEIPVSPTFFPPHFCICCSSTKPKHCKVIIICFEWSSHYLSGIMCVKCLNSILFCFNILVERKKNPERVLPLSVLNIPLTAGENAE